MDISTVFKLFQHEVSDVGTCNPPFQVLLGDRETVQIGAGERSVRQVTGTDDCPVKIALPDDALLALMVRHRVTKYRWENDVPEHKRQVTPTVARPAPIAESTAS